MDGFGVKVRESGGHLCEIVLEGVRSVDARTCLALTRHPRLRCERVRFVDDKLRCVCMDYAGTHVYRSVGARGWCTGRRGERIVSDLCVCSVGVDAPLHAPAPGPARRRGWWERVRRMVRV